MDRRVISLSLSLSLMLLFAGCSGKKVSTSSGDAASRAGQSKSEEIKPDAIKTIPPERSFERPGGSQPSNLSLAPSTASGSNALGDVFFDYDRFQIRKDAMPVLDANAGWLRANGSKTVLIEGHCDERGTLAYNLVLGEKRARAVKKSAAPCCRTSRAIRSRPGEVSAALLPLGQGSAFFLLGTL